MATHIENALQLDKNPKIISGWFPSSTNTSNRNFTHRIGETQELEDLKKMRSGAWYVKCNTYGHAILDCTHDKKCEFYDRCGHDISECYYSKGL